MDWVVFMPGSSTITPPHLGGVILTVDQWSQYVREPLRHFILNNTSYGDITDELGTAWLYYQENSNIPLTAPTPSPHLGLVGRCLIFNKHHSNLPDWAMFCKRGSRGLSEGYIWIKPNTFHTQGGTIPQHSGIYLHALLCWMKHGPPGLPGAYPGPLECAHLCEHKQCTSPWHMAFTSHAINKQRSCNKAKRRRVLPNPPL